jgi:hypothetical protein
MKSPIEGRGPRPLSPGDVGGWKGCWGGGEKGRWGIERCSLGMVFRSSLALLFVSPNVGMMRVGDD